MKNIFEALYRGYGKILKDDTHLKYDLNLPETLNRRYFVNLLTAEKEFNERNILKLAHQSN